MEERQELWIETTKRIIIDSKKPFKKIAEEANVSEQTVARLASGDLSKNKNTGLPTIMRVVASCGGTLSISGSDSRIIGEELINLQVEVERLTNELSIALNELDALRKEFAALSADADLLRLKLDHKEEIITHKEKIISLYGHLDRLLHTEA